MSGAAYFALSGFAYMGYLTYLNYWEYSEEDDGFNLTYISDPNDPEWDNLPIGKIGKIDCKQDNGLIEYLGQYLEMKLKESS